MINKSRVNNISTWYLELQEKGKSPDFEIEVHCICKPQGELKELIENQGIENYKLCREENGISIKMYIGKIDYEDWINKRRKHYYPNNMISVTDEILTISRIGGGHPFSEYTEDEMKLIKVILMNDNIDIIKWKISNSGDGLTGDINREGNSKEDLVKYLESIDYLNCK